MYTLKFNLIIFNMYVYGDRAQLRCQLRVDSGITGIERVYLVKVLVM